jgi:N,N'-diacetylbacillosaminyl-diphospho-undecaprenol alpha-1,3-N-acetylgalactosaminyltransferase
MDNKKGLRIAIVCPDDISIVLFCKGIIQAFQANEANRIYVISDILKEDANGMYAATIRSWGVDHIPLEFYRFFNPLRDLRYTISLFRIFRNEKIDFVMNISTKPNIFGTIAARCANVQKITSSVWGMGAAFVENEGTKMKCLKTSLQFLYWIAFRLNNRVWFTNENDYNYFLLNGVLPKRKGLLTKNYVSTEDYAPLSVSDEQVSALRQTLGLKTSDRVVIMVGRMSWAKGVKEFVDAAAILENRLPHVKFILVGPMDEGSPDSIPETYFIESEKNKNFKWIGFRNDVKELYALSDLAVLPTYYREGGFPRGLTEPMAMGKPVITTESVHCRGTVDEGKNGYLVPIKNAKALAAAIEKLMIDDDKRTRFGRYSREKAVREFDEKAIVPNVIEELLGTS